MVTLGTSPTCWALNRGHFWVAPHGHGGLRSSRFSIFYYFRFAAFQVPRREIAFTMIAPPSMTAMTAMTAMTFASPLSVTVK
jgi:hypothetical protein